jgi:hypothetical protein
VLRSSGGPPSQAERAGAARSAAAEALDGLELVGIEYPQAVHDGRVVAPTEYAAAKADVQRARDAVDRHRADIAAVAPAATARIDAALSAVAAAVATRADEARLRAAVARARSELEPVSAAR